MAVFGVGVYIRVQQMISAPRYIIVGRDTFAKFNTEYGISGEARKGK